MALTPGTRLGSYEILDPLGAGGMGEVYRARDAKLGREVAIKVLPQALARDVDALARFELEARAVAALSHPSILAIHDFGSQDGEFFTVTELLEGRTLDRELQDGPLPVKRAVDFAVQAAQGLAAAHDKGIVHRDLKPENLFVTRDGRVKILDFGLAKQWRPPGGSGGSGVPAPLPLTGTGLVVGTAGYMSPEQVRGEPLDGRSDIFSFGCVLYEMLSGKRAFGRETFAEAMVAALKEEPPELQQRVPPGLERIVRLCLEKRPESRFHSAHDLGLALQSASSPSTGPSPLEPQQPGNRLSIHAVWIAVPVVALALGTLLGRYGPLGGRAPAPAQHNQLTFQPGIESFPSISPDGKMLVYVSAASGNKDIYLRRIDGRNPINLTADSPADDDQPTFSRDGSQIAFRSERGGGGLFVMGATGESVRHVSDFGYNPSWSPDGQEIVFGTESISTPGLRFSTSELWIVSVATGATRLLTKGDAVQPSWSPAGHRIAFWGLPKNKAQRDLYTISARGGTPVPVIEDVFTDWSPLWSPDGKHLYFSSDRGGSMNLWRIPVNEKTGQPGGVPEPLTVPSRFAGQLSLSQDGRLVYAGLEELSIIEKVPLDREVPRATIYRGTLSLQHVDVSPDGEWLALGVLSPQEDLYVMRSNGTELRQVTNDPFKDRYPRWSPDGRVLLFQSDRTGDYQAFTINPDGGGLTQVFNRPGSRVTRLLWSPDGTRIAWRSLPGSHLGRLGQRDVASEPFPALDDKGTYFWPIDWSPDGRRLAGMVSPPNSRHLPGIVIYDLVSRSYSKVTETGAFPRWLGPERLLFVDQGAVWSLGLPARGLTKVVDSAPPSALVAFAPSRDGRYVYVVRNLTEGDIWQVTCSPP